MTTKELFEKSVADAALGEKLQKAKTPEECFEIAKEAGLTDSFEAFVTGAKEIKAEAEKLAPAEVDAVVGGGADTINTTMTITLNTTTISSAMAVSVVACL